jgi:hypothetical protein
MARTKRSVKPLATIWECPDELWEQVIVPVLLALDPPKSTGRKRVDPRAGPQRHHSPPALGLPVEPSAAGLGLPFVDPPHLPTLG